MSSVRDINQKYEQERNNYLELYKNCLKRLEKMEEEISIFPNNYFEYDNTKILKDKIKYYKGMIDFIRPVTEEDIIERNNIFLNYAANMLLK